MSYDDERYQTKQIVPMYKATFAAILGTVATTTSSQTSAILSDRIQFFQKIKLTGMKVIPEVAPDATAHATSQTVRYVLTDGTTAFARAIIGTIAGILANGSVISANIAAAKSLQLTAEVTAWDGTVQTVAPGGGWVQLEYQERF